MSSPAVLVVERDPALMEILNYVLSECGYRVLRATDPLEALSKLLDCSTPPTHLVVDVSAPYMDHWSLIAAIRAHADWRSLPLTLLSTSASCPAVRARTRSEAGEGASILSMPFELDRLLRRLRTCRRAPVGAEEVA